MRASKLARDERRGLVLGDDRRARHAHARLHPLAAIERHLDGAAGAAVEERRACRPAPARAARQPARARSGAAPASRPAPTSSAPRSRRPGSGGGTAPNIRARRSRAAPSASSARQLAHRQRHRDLVPLPDIAHVGEPPLGDRRAARARLDQRARILAPSRRAARRRRRNRTCRAACGGSSPARRKSAPPGIRPPSRRRHWAARSRAPRRASRRRARRAAAPRRRTRSACDRSPPRRARPRARAPRSPCSRTPSRAPRRPRSPASARADRRPPPPARRATRSGLSAIVPPANAAGSIMPSATSASVTVGRMPPRR